MRKAKNSGTNVSGRSQSPSAAQSRIGAGNLVQSPETNETEQLERDPWIDFLERLDEYHRTHPMPPITAEEAVARVRALRDEWD